MLRNCKESKWTLLRARWTISLLETLKSSRKLWVKINRLVQTTALLKKIVIKSEEKPSSTKKQMMRLLWLRIADILRPTSLSSRENLRPKVPKNLLRRGVYKQPTLSKIKSLYNLNRTWMKLRMMVQLEVRTGKLLSLLRCIRRFKERKSSSEIFK